VSLSRVGATKRVPQAGQHPPLAPPRQVQPQGAVHPVDALVVPAVAGAAQPMEALPEAPQRMPRDDLVQCRDNVGIALQPGETRPIVRRPRQPHRLARSAPGEAVLLHQHRQDFSLRGRHHRFRLKTSLIAAFSSANSAYIRLNLAFSTSSSSVA